MEGAEKMTIQAFPFLVARTQFEHSTIVTPSSFTRAIYAAVNDANDRVGKIFRRNVFDEVDGHYSLIYRAVRAIDENGQQIKDPFGRDIFLHEGLAIKGETADKFPLRASHLDAVHAFVAPEFHKRMQLDGRKLHQAPPALRYTDEHALRATEADWAAVDRVPFEKIALHVERHNPTAFGPNPDSNAIGPQRSARLTEAAKPVIQKKSLPSEIGSARFRKEAGNWKEQVRSLRLRPSEISGKGLAICLAGAVAVGAVITWDHFQKSRRGNSPAESSSKGFR